MQRVTSIGFLALATLATLAACGSSSGGDTTAGSGASTTSSGAGACTGATPVELTVLNELAWCDVTVNGGASSGEATIKACVAAGTVTLTAKPEDATFELGDWYGVSGDSGKGTPGTVSGGTSTATATVKGTSACVSVCCPFTSGKGCPGTNACPADG